jgi:hypothetical protein
MNEEIFENRIKGFEGILANAEKYVENGVNIEGDGQFHFDDWAGNSGHPLWMKNKLIPTTKMQIAKEEKKLRKFQDKEKDKRITLAR